MRNIIYILLIFITLFSCKKEEEVEYSTEKTMTAKIDGNLWRAVEPVGGSSSGLYSISGESKIGHKITLYLNAVTIGTFNLSSTSQSKAEYTMPTEGEFYVTQGGAGTSGYIEIDEINPTKKTVTGKFHFVANKVGTHYLRTISNGVFEDIEYYYVAPTAENNIFNATVSGSNYTSTNIVGDKNNGKITINASDNEKSFIVVIPDNITEGTYNLNDSVYSITYSKSPNIYYTTDEGTIKITQHNTSINLIEGTFSLNAYNESDSSDVVNITNGAFQVVY